VVHCLNQWQPTKLFNYVYTMRTLLFLSLCLGTVNSAFGQNAAYMALAKKADPLYQAKDYKNSALTYSSAFKTNGWIGLSTDRYNAACSWALANNADSAFFQLDRIATKAGYANYNHITTDADLVSLHRDERWKPLLVLVNRNKEKAEANFNKPLVVQLDSVYKEDQQYRQQLNDVEKQYGWESNQVKALWAIITEKDAANLIKVRAILDKYGWLGSKVIGQQGNSTLFLIIQHADQQTQETYLPMMRDAVKKGNAAGSALALLEDRVALGQQKRQIYGSQIGRNSQTKQYYVLPLEDPDNVDKRRADVGLEPLAEYVSRWQIKWDVEQYKKDQQANEPKQERK